MNRLGSARRTATLAASDFLALFVPIGLIFLIRAAFGHVDFALYFWVFSVLLAGLPLGAAFGLYRTVSLPPPREIKALFVLGTLLYGIIVVILFWSQTGRVYSRLILTGGWLGAVFALPVLRAAVRRLFARRSWWGRPLLILDKSGVGRNLWRYLKHNPERGLVPVDIYPLPDDVAQAREIFSRACSRYPDAIVMLPHAVGGSRPLAAVMQEAERWFDDILVAPAFCGGEDFLAEIPDVRWLDICDLGLTPALWIRQNLRDKRRLFVKRCIDIIICLCGLPLLLPLGFVLACAIKLDSPGPIFYRHKRIGRGGKEIRIYKFRTMVLNADAVLVRCLEKDKRLREEWQGTHKMKKDPRVTRTGAFLRKTSLDELPQLINVLTGGMSLVGPRPIVAAEVGKYGAIYEEYCRVRPGITGLWQVSGRNNTSYDERVAYDHYYICNWSVWMDVWILCRTVPVAITGYGAY